MPGPSHGRQAASKAAPVTPLLQGGVGLHGDQFREALRVVGPERRWWAAALRLGAQGLGIATSLGQANDKGGADGLLPEIWST